MTSRLSLLFILFIVAGQAVAGTYYVATNGNDTTGDGSIETPWATIEKARDTITGTTGNTVYIRGGTYRITSAIMFDDGDSGADGLPNVYRNYPGEYPVISGGQVLTAEWTDGDEDGIWQCSTSGIEDFNSLWVDGVRATRAREPDTGWYTSVEGPDSTQAFGYTEGNINPAWTNLTSVEIQYIRQMASPRERIASVDDVNNVVWLQGQTWSDFTYFYGGQSYYVENVFEGLDTEGEWYLNMSTSTLYYYPIAEKNPNTSEIIYPVVGRTPTLYVAHLLDIKGSDSDNYVEYIDFQGLTFTHTDWYLPSTGDEGFGGHVERFDGSDSFNSGLGPGVFLGYVRNCSFTSCSMSHIGGNGFMGLGVEDITLSYCEISDIGAHGTRFGTDYYAPYDAAVQTDITVSDCTIHDVGVVFPYGDGLHFAAVGNATAMYNEIYNVPFIALHVGHETGGGEIAWQQNNTVCYNYIHNVCTVLIDAAGLYFAGKQTGTVAHHNKVTDLPVIDEVDYAQAGGSGLYIDSTGEAITVSNNWFIRASTGFFLHEAVSNTIENNVFHTDEEYGSFYLASAGGSGNVVKWNIFYSTAAGEKRMITADSDYFSVSNYNCWDTEGTWDGYPAWWNDWKGTGLDLNSIVADPLFIDAVHDDFNLESGSPALGIGFTQIEGMDTVGPRDEEPPSAQAARRRGAMLHGHNRRQSQ